MLGEFEDDFGGKGAVAEAVVCVGVEVHGWVVGGWVVLEVLVFLGGGFVGQLTLTTNN